MGIHSNSFLLYCVILWLSIKVVHIYMHLLKVIAERHLKKVSPSVFQTVARRSLRGFWKSLKGLSGCFKVRQCTVLWAKQGILTCLSWCKIILAQSFLKQILCYGMAALNDPGKLYNSRFLPSIKYAWLPLIFTPPNPYPCCGDFHFLFYSLIFCLNFYAYLLLSLRKIIKDIS